MWSVEDILLAKCDRKGQKISNVKPLMLHSTTDTTQSCVTSTSNGLNTKQKVTLCRSDAIINQSEPEQTILSCNVSGVYTLGKNGALTVATQE